MSASLQMLLHTLTRGTTATAFGVEAVIRGWLEPKLRPHLTLQVRIKCARKAVRERGGFGRPSSFPVLLIETHKRSGTPTEAWATKEVVVNTDDTNDVRAAINLGQEAGAAAVRQVIARLEQVQAAHDYWKSQAVIAENALADMMVWREIAERRLDALKQAAECCSRPRGVCFPIEYVEWVDDGATEDTSLLEQRERRQDA